MADQWSETTYATVLRQHVNRTHTSFHNSFPVVKSILLGPVELEREHLENGLVPERKTEHIRHTASNAITPDSISSETIYSTDTFVPRQPPRTYIDRVVQGSVDDDGQNPMCTVTQGVPVRQKRTTSPTDSRLVEQNRLNRATQHPKSQECPASPIDSGRIISSQANEKPRCSACQKVVYPLEGLHVMDRVFHKSCFRCRKCQRILSVRTFNVGNGHPYCEPHYVELFRARGRFGVTARDKAVEEDDDYLLHQTAIQSSTPAETAKDRPPPRVTQTLVAKFQQMSNVSKSSHDVRGEPLTIPRPMSLTPENTTREVRARSLSLGKHTIPTPFLQASNLKVHKEVPLPEDTVLNSHPNMQNNEEFPYPGITKDLIAKFSKFSNN
ncbi:LIM domain-containing protein 2 [Clonorchis sinensis]|uniref:LIM domain-containing protein 2 n=1 Tax=Clonorchis sinensis TaxID=79923 RepID=A0A8T1MLW0_CLOSI|nr:LIM domain-containing protein 2 [Clonorchis sinensis]